MAKPVKMLTDQVDVKRTARGQLPHNYIATGKKMQRHPASVSTVAEGSPAQQRKSHVKKGKRK